MPQPRVHRNKTPLHFIENNYHTGYIGKWHLGSIPRNRFIHKHERMGFQEWKVANCTHDYNNSYYFDENNRYHKIKGYESNYQTDLSIDFIERHSACIAKTMLTR